MSGRDGKGYTLFMLVIPGMIAGLILAAGCTGLQTPLPSLRRRPVEYTVFSTSSSGSTAPPDPQAVSGEHRFRGMIPPGAGKHRRPTRRTPASLRS